MTERAEPTVLHIGVLGTAKIVPDALVGPARRVEGVKVVAIASRDVARAEAFATENGIPTVYGSYRDLLADSTLDAVYVPLPPALHANWTIDALEAGRNVLCEKPFASNAGEARAMVDAAQRCRRHLVEAFHWRYHPLADRLLELLPRLGRIRRIEARLDASMPDLGFREQLPLGGGVMMDVGCYPVHWTRTAAGAEAGEPHVVSAVAKQGPTGVDVAMRAQLRFASGLEATVVASMAVGPSLTPSCSTLRVEGDSGELEITNPMLPQIGNRLRANFANDPAVDEAATVEPTYDFQLEAFREILAGRLAAPTGDVDAIGNMATIDAIYLAAGMSPRGSVELAPGLTHRR